MYHTNENPISLKRGHTYKALELNDVILVTDLYRDFGDESSIKWEYTKTSMPYWIGKTVHEFAVKVYAIDFSTERYEQYFEIVRDVTVYIKI